MTMDISMYDHVSVSSTSFFPEDFIVRQPGITSVMADLMSENDYKLWYYEDKLGWLLMEMI